VSAAAFLLLLPGFLIAQASALSTWAYLLLRKRGDGTDLAVVFAGEPAASQARETDEPSPAPVKAGESDPSEEGG
jgi:hypothetical protein